MHSETTAVETVASLILRFVHLHLPAISTDAVKTIRHVMTVMTVTSNVPDSAFTSLFLC